MGAVKEDHQTVDGKSATNACAIWVLEQNLELRPLQIPVRRVVVRIEDTMLWANTPLASMHEFIKSVGSYSNSGTVAHIMALTYSLEHEVFVKDYLRRWPC